MCLVCLFVRLFVLFRRPQRMVPTDAHVVSFAVGGWRVGLPASRRHSSIVHLIHIIQQIRNYLLLIVLLT